jgi:hypothetical protein
LTLKLIQLGSEDLEVLPTDVTLFEMDIHERSICDSSPCQNTGNCIPDTSVDAGYVCLCSFGWTGQNCEEKDAGLGRYLRGNPSEEDNFESRVLQSGTTTWACSKNGYGDWGHTSGDAAWACNN